ncbi:MAG TPA: NAD(P)H-hydrate epimerase [Candidatus Dormibacteraeota bacterium]|jgi:NAD(P)H-hydrate epimerase|nr:NAD(P)H-hydrate epimerase [Candidatus Dormibacteraeota bacterium]
MSVVATRRFGDLLPEQLAALDEAAVRSGVSVLQLMEIAGWQVARCAWRMVKRQPAAVTVVAGRGNNGGDGMVAARHLATWGCDVRAVIVGVDDESSLGDLQGSHVATARASGVEVESSVDAARVGPALQGVELVLDAVLGTGLRGDPRVADAAAIVAMNGSGLPVLAVDVPSGLDAGTGEPHRTCVRARATCTLVAMKRGLWTEAGRAQAGTVYVADIGMPAAAWREVGMEPPPGVRGGGLVRLG